jgi:hypothetical protein
VARQSVLFICNLFNNALSNWDNVMSNDWMILSNELYMI